MGTDLATTAGPADLADAGNGLRGARSGMGSYQRGALAAAIHMGQYLHWAWEETNHASRAYGRFLARYFQGDRKTAHTYRTIAEAYFADPEAFAGCTSIEAAKAVKRTVTVADLPKWIGPERQRRPAKPRRPREVRYPLTEGQLVAISGRRADDVRAWLEAQGVDGRLLTQGP